MSIFENILAFLFLNYIEAEKKIEEELSRRPSTERDIINRILNKATQHARPPVHQDTFSRPSAPILAAARQWAAPAAGFGVLSAQGDNHGFRGNLIDLTSPTAQSPITALIRETVGRRYVPNRPVVAESFARPPIRRPAELPVLNQVPLNRPALTPPRAHEVPVRPVPVPAARRVNPFAQAPTEQRPRWR